MPDYNLEILRSSGGVTDGDFTLLSTLVGVTIGAPFALPDPGDTNVIPGWLYIYRARYIDASNSSQFSDWSNLAFARAPYPLVNPLLKGTPSMGCVVTAAETQMGLGVERTPGQNVQVAFGVDALSSDFAAQVNKAESQANRNTVSAVSDETAAASTVGGSMNWDLRANGGSLRLLLSYYKLLSTQVIAAANGVPEYYIHKLVPAFTEQPVTLVDKQGPVAFLMAGARGNTLTISSDKTATTPIRAQGAFMGLNYLTYPASTTDDLALTGLSGLSYDMTKYGPTDWVLTTSGVQSPDAKSYNFSFNRNLQPKDVANYHMGATCHYPDKSAVSLSANLYWGGGLNDIRNYYGITDSTLLVFGVRKTILTTEIRVVHQPPKNSSGYINKLEMVFPVCSVRSLLKPVGESGAIMQDITYQPRQDPSQGFIDHYLLITSGETAAAITAPQPETPATPQTELYPWNCVPGVVSGGATTTSIASDANVYLEATDDYYNGKYLLITTGALAGQRQLITDYVGSTRTFTTAAFGSAPATGVKFVIENGFPSEDAD